MDDPKSKKGKKMKNENLENDDHLEPEFAETPEKNKRVHQKLDQVQAEDQHEAQRSKEGILKQISKKDIKLKPHERKIG